MLVNSATYEAATLAHRAGRLEEAIELYTQVIAQDRTNAQARYLLGCILMDREQTKKAAELFESAIKLNDNVPSYHGAYGFLLMHDNREDECFAHLRKAVSLPRAQLDVHIVMANALSRFRHYDEALEFLDKTREKFGHSTKLLKLFIEISSRSYDTKRLRDEVRIGQANGWLKDEYATSILCKAAFMEKKPDEALRMAREWIKKTNGSDQAKEAYADVLADSGLLSESLPYYLGLLEKTPESVDLTAKIGSVFMRMERFQDAARYYRLATRLKPDSDEFLCPFTYAVFKTTGNASNAAQMSVAYHFATKAYQARPKDCNAAMNLSSVLLKMLRVKEGLEYYKRAVDLNPSHHANVSSRLFHLNYSESMTREEILDAHKKWNDDNRVRVGEPRTHFDNDPNPERRLRIGFVSADYMFHPVSYFFIGACRALLKDFDVCLYSNIAVDAEDSLTRQYKSEVTLFRNVNGISDDTFQKLVIDDRIDVMFDLSGHTSGNQLVAMSKRLAPVQIEWLGYPNTTGLDTMDYRISDDITEPEGDADKFSTEKILRLPGGFHLYKPPYAIPPVSELSALRTKIITFGSFNNMKKVSVQAIELWCNLMKAVPNSRLVLKDRNLEAPSSMSRVKTLFASYGIDFSRITTKGLIRNNFEHMRAYSAVDIALDSFPYTGTTTTCEALIMGCPVVTMAGDSHVSRVSASLLTHLGHPEWVANSPDEFVKIGCSLASDTDALAKIRANLRKELTASPVCDEERMRVELGAAIRQAWRAWCKRKTAE